MMDSSKLRKPGAKDDIFFLSCLKQDVFEDRSSNSQFHIEPSTVLLQYHPVIQPHQTIKIVNHTSHSQRCFVLPIESDYLKTKFKNQESIAPGLCMTVEVFLNTMSMEDLEGQIAELKVYCFDDENLMVPIKVIGPEETLDYKIPKNIDFGLVPLCDSVSRKIMISQNTMENDISNVTILEPHVDVTVHIINGNNVNEPSYVEVTYCPTSYTTMTMSMIIMSPAFKNHFPIVNVTGYCRPPPYKDELQNTTEKKVIFLKQCQKELNKRNKVYQEIEDERRARKQYHKKKPLVDDMSDHRPDFRLWWLQKDFVKPQQSDVLLGPLGRTDEEDAEMKNMNEDIFQQEVTNIKQRIKQINLHKDIENLGRTGEGRSSCGMDYETDWQLYMNLRTLPTDESVFKCNELVAFKQRIVKHPEQSPEGKIKKSVPCYSWFTRFHPLCKFIQAGRQVIIRNRLAKRLHLLQLYILDLQRPDIEEENKLTVEPTKIKFFGSEYTTFTP